MYQQLLDKLQEEELIEVLQRLVSIPSISGNEQEIAKYIAGYCLELGLQTEIDKHGNVIAILKGNKPGPRIALNSHMDTVGYGEGWSDDPLSGKVVDGKLYGRGSCDCKASIACHLLTVKAIKELDTDLYGDIVITHVVEEEVQNASRKGTYKLLEDGFQADMAINGEAIDMNIGLGGGGMVEIQITTHGKRAHGSTPFEGVNAIQSMMLIMQEINELKPGYHPYTGNGSIVLGVIEGGERSSVVPDECVLKVSRFIVPGERGEDFLKEIKEIAENLHQQYPEFSATVVMTYESKPSLIEELEPIVQHMVKAHEQLGMPYQFSGTPQHCDVDYLVNKGNIPTVIYGPGRIKVGHIPDEYVELSEVKTAAKIYALTLYGALKG